MTTDYEIRPATPSDAEAMLVVHVAAIFERGSDAYADRPVSV
ncbi:hypothetical protein ACAH01_00150 [Halomicrobium sp. HM KBTZ05]|nr:hypothetical protein [Halomicrobium mukohataei]